MRCLLGILMILFTHAASSAVSRCLDDVGRIHFSQFGCPPDAMPAPDERDSSPISVVAAPPLNPEQKRALARLEQALERDRSARARARESAARAREKEIRADAARCSEARRRLEALAATRRKGYSAAAEPHLEEEEARWRAARKEAC